MIRKCHIGNRKPVETDNVVLMANFLIYRIIIPIYCETRQQIKMFPLSLDNFLIYIFYELKNIYKRKIGPRSH